MVFGEVVNCVVGGVGELVALLVVLVVLGGVVGGVVNNSVVKLYLLAT